MKKERILTPKKAKELVDSLDILTDDDIEHINQRIISSIASKRKIQIFRPNGHYLGTDPYLEAASKLLTKRRWKVKKTSNAPYNEGGKLVDHD